MTPKLTTIGAIVVAIGLASFGPVLWHDYSLFLSYGTGGLPHNPLGWILSGAPLRMMGVEMLSTTQYEKSIDKKAGYCNFFLHLAAAHGHRWDYKQYRKGSFHRFLMKNSMRCYTTIPH